MGSYLYDGGGEDVAGWTGTGETDGARDDDRAIIAECAVALMDEVTMENKRTPRFTWSTTSSFGRWASLLWSE
jgi:hypothetical protein